MQRGEILDHLDRLDRLPAKDRAAARGDWIVLRAELSRLDKPKRQGEQQ